MLTLRPYQQEGVDFLVKKRRAMLADSPGLGKTFQACEAAIQASDGPHLIVAPAHLVKQWAMFIQGQYPDKAVSYAQKNHYLVRQHALDQRADFYVCAVSMLQDFDEFKWPKFKTLILDESHHYKSRRTHQSRGARELASKADNLFLLSATPVRREFDDMWHQLHLIDPDMFSSYRAFVDAFCVSEYIPWGLDHTNVLGIKSHKASDLRKVLDMYMLRRSYDDVGMYLPELIEQTIYVEFDEAMQKTYDRVKNEYRLQFEEWQSSDEAIPFYWAVEVIQVLRQLTCCTAKIKTAVDLALDLPRPLIFTWYQASAEVLAGALGKQAVTGLVKPSERSAIIQDQTIGVATLGALSEGVDLSDFRSVIFFEEHYSPGVNFQGLSRLARFGFPEGVHLPIYYIHVEGSIDEVVHLKAEARSKTIQELIKEVLI